MVGDKRVSMEENADLLAPISDKDKKGAVMEADKDSALGPDGFLNSFYNANWEIIKEDISLFIRDFLCRAS